MALIQDRWRIVVRQRQPRYKESPGEVRGWGETNLGPTASGFTVQRVTLVAPTHGLIVVKAGLSTHPIGIGAPATMASGLIVYPAHVRPRQEVQIVFFLTAKSPGIYDAHGLNIDYQMGGNEYQAFYPRAVRLCVGRVSCPTLAPPSQAVG